MRVEFQINFRFGAPGAGALARQTGFGALYFLLLANERALAFQIIEALLVAGGNRAEALQNCNFAYLQLNYCDYERPRLG